MLAGGFIKRHEEKYFSYLTQRLGALPAYQKAMTIAGLAATAPKS